MATQAQARAYYDLPHESQAARVRRYVRYHFLCDVKQIANALSIPPGRVTARLNTHLASGEIGWKDCPDGGNTRYYISDCGIERKANAAKYAAINHPVTKLWKRLKQDGKGTPTIYAHLMAVYNEMEGTSF